jgi:hypothetical protein
LGNKDAHEHRGGGNVLADEAAVDAKSGGVEPALIDTRFSQM